MKVINEKAANYAAQKTNELMVKAIAQAYADGYNTGYKECAEDNDIDLYVTTKDGDKLLDATF